MTAFECYTGNCYFFHFMSFKCIYVEYGLELSCSVLIPYHLSKFPSARLKCCVRHLLTLIRVDKKCTFHCCSLSPVRFGRIAIMLPPKKFWQHSIKDLVDLSEVTAYVSSNFQLTSSLGVARKLLKIGETMQYCVVWSVFGITV